MTCRQQKTAHEDLAVAVSKLLHLELSNGSARVDTDSQATQTLKQVSILRIFIYELVLLSQYNIEYYISKKNILEATIACG